MGDPTKHATSNVANTACVLKYLVDNPTKWLTSSEIAHGLLTSAMSVATHLKALEKYGLIEAQLVKDGRSHVLHWHTRVRLI